VKHLYILLAVEAMTNLNGTGIASYIPLSNNTVSRQEMAYDVEIKLCDIL
jgi:hypothetical protein